MKIGQLETLPNADKIMKDWKVVYTEDESLGKKYSDGKAPLYTMMSQFKLALQEVAKCTQKGHLKYKEFDQDYMNFKRVNNAEFQYKNAAVRHLMEEGVDKDGIEYGEVLHLACAAWNILAALEIKLESSQEKL